MQVNNTPLAGLIEVTLDKFGDERGFFVERFNKAKFADAGLPIDFDQDNHSRSAPGVLRGLHYQTEPYQGKLVGCLNGSIWDVAVDIRPSSPTYGQWYGTELSDNNAKLLWIPPGFAHGFCVLGDKPADVLYKVVGLYNPKTDAGISYNDTDIGINWPIDSPTLSAKDQNLISFAQYKQNPVDWK